MLRKINEATSEEKIKIINSLEKDQPDVGIILTDLLNSATIENAVKCEILKVAEKLGYSNLVPWAKNNVDSTDNSLKFSCLNYLACYSQYDAMLTLYGFLTSSDNNNIDISKRILSITKSRKIVSQISEFFNSFDDEKHTIAKLLLTNLDFSDMNFCEILIEEFLKQPSTDFFVEIQIFMRNLKIQDRSRLLNKLAEVPSFPISSEALLFRHKLISDFKCETFPVDSPAETQIREVSNSKKNISHTSNIAAISAIIVLAIIILRVSFSENPDQKVSRNYSYQFSEITSKPVKMEGTVVEYRNQSGLYLIHMEKGGNLLLQVPEPISKGILLPREKIIFYFTPIRVNSEGITIAKCTSVSW
ncbi:MAG: hypothetical protein HQM10_25110 [Candidatus Riflebacteria bacterium]|nr:hypothetical protein [Candidatus Riflebacteria bacterium]